MQTTAHKVFTKIPAAGSAYPAVQCAVLIYTVNIGSTLLKTAIDKMNIPTTGPNAAPETWPIKTVIKDQHTVTVVEYIPSGGAVWYRVSPSNPRHVHIVHCTIGCNQPMQPNKTHASNTDE